MFGEKDTRFTICPENWDQLIENSTGKAHSGEKFRKRRTGNRENPRFPFQANWWDNSGTSSPDRLWKCAPLRAFIFASFYQITLKLGNLTDFKTLFPVASTDFRQFDFTKLNKKKKTPWTSLLPKKAHWKLLVVYYGGFFLITRMFFVEK